VRTYKVWGNKIIIYQENNELIRVNINDTPSIPKPLKKGLSISVEQIA